MNEIYFKDKYLKDKRLKDKHLKDTKTRVKEVLRVVLVIIAVLAIAYCIPIFHPVYLKSNWFCKYDVLLNGFHAEVGEYHSSASESTIKIPTILYGRVVTDVKAYAWRNYEGNIKVIYLPDTITRIRYGAFLENESIEEIYAEKIKVVEGHAFNHAEKLHTVELGDYLEIVGGGGFKECKNLKHFNYPDSLTNIKFDAFRGSGVENIPENKEVRIWKDAFCDTPWENNNREVFVTFDYYYYQYDKTMNTLLKYNGKEKTVVIPEGVEIVGCGWGHTEEAKLHTLVDEVFLPDTVTELRENIFIGQEHLTMYIPNSVEKIWSSNACIEQIVTIKGSYAESFAKEKQIPVESLSEEEFWSRYPESTKAEE